MLRRGLWEVGIGRRGVRVIGELEARRACITAREVEALALAGRNKGDKPPTKLGNISSQFNVPVAAHIWELRDVRINVRDFQVLADHGAIDPSVNVVSDDHILLMIS